MALSDLSTEERITFLELRLARYDRLIGKLIAYAKLTPSGRVLLKMLGLS